ncbi:unnamed protein product [Cylicocyclus nassatus]|uniref:Uncharacterized protein n=1 Tax=Cylicocyclus nassatus TaxID=53992 RepID=A0AA36GKC3_CYLNA|nr:unnamed protein product [Cylicocyclus nassatus]
MSDVPGPSKYSEVDMEENEEEDGNTPNNTPSMDAFGEEVANPIQDLIDKLNEELEQLRKDAKEKEVNGGEESQGKPQQNRAATQILTSRAEDPTNGKPSAGAHATTTTEGGSARTSDGFAIEVSTCGKRQVQICLWILHPYVRYGLRCVRNHQRPQGEDEANAPLHTLFPTAHVK